MQNFATDLDSASKSYSFRPQLLVNFMSLGQTPKKIRPKKNEFNYRFQEFSLSGYVPVFERKKSFSQAGIYKASSLTILVTGSLSSSRAFFSFATTNPVIRISAGLRALYYDGNKSIWMFSLSPFLAEETGLLKNAVPRFFSNVLYTRMVNNYFSYRMGFSYTYLFNGGALLPLLGFRVGDYQKVFFNVQFPRDISLYYTINNHWQTGIFTRLSGGIYRFSVRDRFKGFGDEIGNAVLYRSDILTGVMLNYSPNSQIYFSLNAGFANPRSINVAFSNEFIPVKGHVIKNKTAAPSAFINFSMAFYFGKPTYSGAYNYLIEQKAANNSIDVGDLNLGNNQATHDMNKVSVKDINKNDLKKLNDQYMDVKDFLLDD